MTAKLDQVPVWYTFELCLVPLLEPRKSGILQSLILHDTLVRDFTDSFLMVADAGKIRLVFVRGDYFDLFRAALQR